MPDLKGDEVLQRFHIASPMEPPIIENNGFIDKYIGDAIMALVAQLETSLS